MKGILAQILANGLKAGEGVAAGFDTVRDLGGLDVWLLAVGFGFQLFFDFAGYSNIVIGAARALGFRLEENFDSPFLASTPSEFWTKWHMSLSFWIRDYVFMPLASMRRNVRWRYFALLFSMTLFGLWHGAKLTYIAWGSFHGALLVLHRIGQKTQRDWGLDMSGRAWGGISRGLTFATVALGWILFRANDTRQAVEMLRQVSSFRGYARLGLPAGCYPLVLAFILGYFAYVSAAAAIDPIFKRPAPGRRGLARLWDKRIWWAAPMLGLLLAMGLALTFTAGERISPFIYALF